MKIKLATAISAAILAVVIHAQAQSGPPNPGGTNSPPGTNTPPPYIPYVPPPCGANLLWTFYPWPIDTEYGVIPPVFDGNGNCYLSGQALQYNFQDTLISLHLTPSGAVTNWMLLLGNTNTLRPGMTGQMAMADDGTIYIAGQNVIWAVNPVTMTTNWLYRLTNATSGFLPNCPAIAPDGSVYICDRDKGLLWHFRNATNFSTWSLPAAFGSSPSGDAPMLSQTTPVIGPDGTVFLGTRANSSNVSYFLAITNSAVKWSRAVTNLSFSHNAATMDQALGAHCALTSAGMLYVTLATNTSYAGQLANPNTSPQSTNAVLMALVANTGSISWIFTNAFGCQGLGQPMVGSDGSVYMIGDDETYPTNGGTLYGSLWAVDKNGRFKWTFTDTNGFGFREGSVLLTADGSIWALAEGGNLWQIDQNTGYALTNSLSVGPASVASEITLGNDATLYIPQNNGFSAYQVCAPVSCSSWPQYQRNERHTSRMLEPLVSGLNYTNKTFSFNMAGLTNSVCDVCASTNLENWASIGTVKFTSTNAVKFTDTNSPNLPYRFYHLSGQ